MWPDATIGRHSRLALAQAAATGENLVEDIPLEHPQIGRRRTQQMVYELALRGSALYAACCTAEAAIALTSISRLTRALCVASDVPGMHCNGLEEVDGAREVDIWLQFSAARVQRCHDLQCVAAAVGRTRIGSAGWTEIGRSLQITHAVARMAALERDRQQNGKTRTRRYVQSSIELQPVL